ncbi:MAG: pantoate--beta-alanine ligase [Bacteroidota bacterium]
MEIFKEIGPIRAFLRSRKTGPVSIGFVPTMGALHEGHLRLIRTSRQQNDLTVCSIYVNPIQFNNPADLEKYPRTLAADIKLLEQENCDVLFVPSNDTMYSKPATVSFQFGTLDQTLEGAFRPGHFSGVALVVAKLFNIVQPTHAYFGQKDYQQFLIVSRLVDELQFDLQLHCEPTVREADGLALSSRNQRLSAEGRKNALILFETLQNARQQLTAGKSWPEVKQTAIEHIAQSGKAQLEYLALADRENLMEAENVTPQNLNNAILLVAAYVENVRLIDNLFVAYEKS